MKKIKTIHLRNFKFFADNEPIKIENKHVLLYGENGSGKSSIYWALYTLLESANKSDPAQIQKYFTKANPDSLVNIHYTPPVGENPTIDSFVKIVLEDGNSYEISSQNTLINQNQEAKKSNYASDFLNYRFLYKAYNFKHSDKIDLMKMFEDEIFPYVNFANFNASVRNEDDRMVNRDITNANQMLSYYLKRKVHNTYLRRLKEHLISELRVFLNAITPKINEILINKLGYSITLQLSFSEPAFENYLKNKVDRNEPIISLEILNYYGKGDAVNKPQSFLNEAKLTAIGLAIRLAVLENRLQDAEVKILVLDDLLISLDMSNREKVIDLIMNEYLNRYQVFIFTHERVLFEDIKATIYNHHKKLGRLAGITEQNDLDTEWEKHWQLLEMYEAEKDASKKIPIVLPHLSNIQKAYFYLKEQVDYNACGNNLRSAFEDFFRAYLPYQSFLNANGQNQNPENFTLGSLITLAKEYYQSIGFDLSLLDKLDRYKDRSLNKTSHFNPRSNFYKKELEDAFIIFNQLKANRNDIILATDEQIKFFIETNAGARYEYTAILRDDIRLYKRNDGSPSFYKNSDKRNYAVTSSLRDGVETFPQGRPPFETPLFTLEEFYMETIKGLQNITKETAITQTDMYQVFTDIDNSTLENLKKY